MVSLLICLLIAMLPIWLFGAITIFQILRKPPAPVDASNIFNRFRLFWFAITRQNRFVSICPWLLNDELKNMEKNNEP